MISDLGFSTVGQNQINMNIKIHKFDLAQKFFKYFKFKYYSKFNIFIYFFIILKKLLKIGF